MAIMIAGQYTEELSNREIEVIRLLAEGKSMKEAAKELYISHHTVMSHVKNANLKRNNTKTIKTIVDCVRRGLLTLFIIHYSLFINAQGIKPKQLQNADSISSILLSDSNKRYQHADINDVITYDTIAGRDRVTQGHILLAGVDQETDTVKYYVSGLTTVQSGTDNQELNLDLNTNILSLERGSHVDLTLYRNGQPLDTFTIVNDSIRISVTNDQVGFFSVDLSPYLDNTDDQTIDTFTIVANVLRLSVEGDGQAYKSVDLAPYLDNTDDQVIDTFTIVGNVLRLSVEGDGQAYKSVNLAPYLDNTDNQDLSLTANILSLTNDATTVDLSPYLDNTVLSQEQVQDYVGPMVANNTENGIVVTYDDANNVFNFSVTDQSTSNELQTISTNGTAGNISISSGNTITLNVNDADASTTNELQTIDVLSLTGSTLNISLLNDGEATKTLDLSSLTGGGDNIYNTDGTLTGNRIVTMGANSLDFYSGNNNNTFSITSSTAGYDSELRIGEGADYGGILRYDGGSNWMDIGSQDINGQYYAIRLNRGSTTVTLPAYTGTTKDAIPTKDIGVDASGNLVTFAVPSGGSSIWTELSGDIYWNGLNGQGVAIQGTSAQGELDVYGDNNDGPSISILSSDAIVSSGDILGQIVFDANDNRSSVDGAAMIRAVAAGDHLLNSKSASLRFYTKTTGNGTTASANERMRLEEDGDVFFYSGSSGTDFTASPADDFIVTPGDDIVLDAASGSIDMTAGFVTSTVSGFGRMLIASEFQTDIEAGTINFTTSTAFNSNRALNVTSDERLKKSIKEIGYGLDEILRLVPVSYKIKEKSDGVHLGLIAQDVQRIMPEVVGENEDGYLSLAYTELIAPLIRAIQEQQVQINALQKEIKELKKDK